MTERIFIGLHELEFEEPDLVHMWTRGEARAEEAPRVADAIVAFAPGRDVYMLGRFEAGAGAGMSPEARKLFAEGMKRTHLVAAAMVGGTFRAQIMVRLLAGVLRLISNSYPELRFFSTESDARDWLGSRGCRACGG